MKNPYSFLKDELAILEIRKHKWIESEKIGYEIGFATATLDWIKRYGEGFKQFRLSLKNPDNILSEKRRHRRFNFKFPVQIKTSEENFNCQTNDISLIGLSCSIPKFIPFNTETNVTIGFQKEEETLIPTSFRFKSRVARILKPQAPGDLKLYQVFVPFNEKVRDFLRTHTELLKN